MIKKKMSPFFLLFLWLYRWLAVPLFLTILFTFGLWLSPKIRKSFRLRRESIRRPKPQWMGKVRPVWIHASSGEFEYAKSLIRELKEQGPDIPILVTYFSPSYFKSIANTKGVDWHEPLPLDTQAATQSFIKLWKPKILLIARTDLWPELLFQCGRAQVPSILFSATFSEKKVKSFFSRQLLRLLIPLLDEVHVVSQEDQDKLTQITQYKNKHYVTGDTRYDQVHFRLTHPNALKLELKPAAGDSVLIAGSTWPEDEDVLLASLSSFVKSGQLRLMIAPHEPTNKHLANLEYRLSELGLQSLRYSQASQWTQNTVLLIDEVGILADLYSWGQLAFVGGSFRNSVHSVMEPLGSGSLTFVGPHHHNNREAIEFKKIPAIDDASKKLAAVYCLKMVEAIESSEQWTQKLKLWLSIPESHALISKQIAHEVLQKGGASKRIADHFSPLFRIIVQK